MVNIEFLTFYIVVIKITLHFLKMDLIFIKLLPSYYMNSNKQLFLREI